MSLNLSATTTTSPSQALAVDVRSLDSLKYESGPKAAREAAKQFESLFMREMIKSMREATMKSGLLDSAQGDLGADMLDQQLSVQMSGTAGGLTDAITRQLTQQMGLAGGGADPSFAVPSTLSLSQSSQLRQRATAATTPAAPTGGTQGVQALSPKGRDNFVEHHSDAAHRVSRESGIPASFMLGQAGHETGWGKSEIKAADGSNSFNLFGIKAGKGWTGKVAEITTTEYINGTPRKVVAKFRAYDSYEDSFRDYARLINDNPRYEKAREKVGSAVAYATELQRAGYATDPEYARKLSGAIQSALRAQRAQA